MRNRLKVAQVEAMLRLKLLCPPYDQFEYQPAIDMFSKGLDSGLLAQLNKEGKLLLWQRMRKMMCRTSMMLTVKQPYQSVL